MKLTAALLGATVMLIASCQIGGAPTNGIAEVANLSSAAASFQWQSPGLLGTRLFGASGTEPIGACGTYSRAFGAGDQTITIESLYSRRSFVLQAPQDTQAVLVIVITADGGIESVDPQRVPPSPFCR